MRVSVVFIVAVTVRPFHHYTVSLIVGRRIRTALSWNQVGMDNLRLRYESGLTRDALKFHSLSWRLSRDRRQDLCDRKR